MVMEATCCGTRGLGGPLCLWAEGQRCHAVEAPRCFVYGAPGLLEGWQVVVVSRTLVRIVFAGAKLEAAEGADRYEERGNRKDT